MTKCDAGGVVICTGVSESEFKITSSSAGSNMVKSH